MRATRTNHLVAARQLFHRSEAPMCCPGPYEEQARSLEVESRSYEEQARSLEVESRSHEQQPRHECRGRRGGKSPPFGGLAIYPKAHAPPEFRLRVSRDAVSLPA